MKQETLDKYQLILDLMATNPDSPKTRIAEMADTSPRTVNRALDWQKRSGYIAGKQELKEPGLIENEDFQDDEDWDEDEYDYVNGMYEPDPVPVVSAEKEYAPGYPKFVLTTMAVTIMFSPDGDPVLIDKSHANFDMVVEAVKDGDWEYVEKNSSIKNAVQEYSNGLISFDGDQLMYAEFPVDNTLARYIIELFSQGEEPLPLIRFLENLMANPDPRAVSEIYDFIRACDLPITDDGHFLAYKKVRRDYKDCHSGTIDNSVGAKPKMPRSMVDTDKHNTCSRGLHFCSKSYLNSFGGDRIMVVKINPADVVAIPADYNNAKGRAWTYEVVSELENGAEIVPYYASEY